MPRPMLVMALPLSLTAFASPVAASPESLRAGAEGLRASAVEAHASTAQRARRPTQYSKWALVTGYDAPVFDTFETGRKVIGRIRAGSRVGVRPVPTENTCYAHDTQGLWLATPGGFICTSYGMAVGRSPRLQRSAYHHVDGRSVLPFEYVKVTRYGTPRYRQPRTDRELLVENQTKAFFLAKDRILTVDGQNWIRTAYDEYVQAPKTRPVHPPRLRGVELTKTKRLPLAFVVGAEDRVRRYCKKGRSVVACGDVPRFSYFAPRRRVSRGGSTYIADRKGRLYPTDNVRLIQSVARPDGVPSRARWVHIDLDQQFFVAYSGDRPRYASLVSSGVAGHETPTGLYRTQRKYLTKTMTGPDDSQGRYRVEEIPWVMYYRGKYALHGAYWHEQFGNVRSHGCTNLAPVDAKWLFEWDLSPMPAGWHSNLEARGGLYYYFTRRPSEQTASR